MIKVWFQTTLRSRVFGKGITFPNLVDNFPAKLANVIPNMYRSILFQYYQEILGLNKNEADKQSRIQMHIYFK